jgi:hypothetical protein
MLKMICEFFTILQDKVDKFFSVQQSNNNYYIPKKLSVYRPQHKSRKYRRKK